MSDQGSAYFMLSRYAWLASDGSILGSCFLKLRGVRALLLLQLVNPKLFLGSGTQGEI